MKHIHKKSQMEILGLAIVIVLVLLAVIFVVKYLLVKKPAEYRQNFQSSQLASGMINTFLKTTTADCSKETMRDLLQDCAASGTITCPNGKSSCDYFKDVAKSIFLKTLDEWKFKYSFTASTGASAQIMGIGTPCQGSRQSEQYFVPAAAPIEVRLDICT